MAQMERRFIKVRQRVGIEQPRRAHLHRRSAPTGSEYNRHDGGRDASPTLIARQLGFRLQVYRFLREG